MDGQGVVDRDETSGPADAAGRAEPRLTGSVPTLPSLDFDETIGFYERLGFSVQFRDIGLLGLVRDGVRLHFWLTGNKRIPQSSSCWIDVEGIDALHAAFAPLKVVHRRGKLETKPWGIREFHVADCHGNLLRFCQLVAEAPAATSDH